ncbi:MAG: hypothetical protein E7Z73_06165 [Methanobrevibacter millerae]|uniref:Uncharacterized protein n=1 Tax=Methanobrevibacter millerae TaxID=230361 RepID=A0A8T3VB34_9EURY|nr:hypothetical protein [Methanobrevibacter millerae]MBE6505309.1 hypothetical protein [Methanobrevibacter millerae]
MINEKFANDITTFNISNSIDSLFSLKDNFHSDVSYKSDCRAFYEKLLEVSKSKGLGDNISIQTIYDGNIPEKVFTIHIGQKLSKNDKYVLLDEITNYMGIYAKNNMLRNFYKDAYIIIK